jgi:hypothetical protein
MPIVAGPHEGFGQQAGNHTRRPCALPRLAHRKSVAAERRNVIARMVAS